MPYQGVNVKDHPECIVVDKNGDLHKSSFWDSEDNKNIYMACPNVEGYQVAMVAWVQKLMQLGADGIFADNLSQCVPCYGPQVGKHAHVYRLKNPNDDSENQQVQTHAMAMLLKSARAVIKECNSEGVILGNSGNPPTALPPEFWQYLDADMLESYICSWAWPDRGEKAGYTWDVWQKKGANLRGVLKDGKQVQALSYLGVTPYGVREDAFFCYATARLAGFVWNGGLPLSTPDTAALYRIRLGRPLTGETVSPAGVHYRVFERGVVAVNPDKANSLSFPVGPPMPARQFLDLFGKKVASSWTRYPDVGYNLDSKVTHSGLFSITCSLQSATQSGGADQNVELDQAKATPLVASGYSKAKDVSGSRDGNYSLYVDVAYNDGTNLFGQVAPFSSGTHDWEQQSVTIHPEKPIKSLTIYALFRNHTGHVWFDDVSLKELGGDVELLHNTGFEETEDRNPILDAGTSQNTLEVPPYSGRVYLFASQTDDQLTKTGPTLTVATSPPLGDVKFRIDGFAYWTHSGYGTAAGYELGWEFGSLAIVIDGPGSHTIELVDNPARVLPGGNDPGKPTQPNNGKKYVFSQWADGLGDSQKIQVNVSNDAQVVAQFSVQHA
jgi:hypothetical protein